MNFTGFQSSTTLLVNLNTNGNNLNTQTPNNPNVLPGSVVLVNTSAVVAPGQFPVFNSNNLSNTAASAIISESGGGINIDGSLAIAGYADVAATLNNIATVINNLTGLTV